MNIIYTKHAGDLYRGSVDTRVFYRVEESPTLTTNVLLVSDLDTVDILTNSQIEIELTLMSQNMGYIEGVEVRVPDSDIINKLDSIHTSGFSTNYRYQYDTDSFHMFGFTIYNQGQWYEINNNNWSIEIV